MELANQYGVNLGNIYKTVADVKGAEQEQEVRQEQLNKYRRERLKELSDDQIKQARAITEMHGKAALYARQNVPEGQRGQYIAQYVSTLPKEAQEAFAQKYGTDPAQIEGKIPFMLNDIINADKELEALAKEREAKQKHEYALEEEGVKGAIRYGEEELRGRNVLAGKREEIEGRKEVANIYTAGREKVAGMKGASGGAQGKGGAGKPHLISYEIKTKTDPKTGEKTTVRVNKWSDGTTTSSEPDGGLKPPPPLVKQPSKGATYKPSEVVKYGTKNGRKVAMMKDGSVIYVK